MLKMDIYIYLKNKNLTFIGDNLRLWGGGLTNTWVIQSVAHLKLQYLKVG